MNILKYVFDKFGCKHEAYDKKDIDNKIKTINDSLSSINTNITTINSNINTANTKITNLQSKVFLKENFVILEGNINIQTNETGRHIGSRTFSYPTGFTKNNSIIISHMLSSLSGTTNESYNTSMGISSNGYISSTINIALFNNNISVTCFDSSASGNHTVKIMLLRYK